MKKILRILAVLVLMVCSFIAGRHSVLDVMDTVRPTITSIPYVTSTPRPTATPRPTYQPLARGDRGDEVSRLQRNLNSHGFDVGTADGIYGAKTEAAVKKFQAEAGLTVTGIADDATLALLYSANAPRITATPRPTKTPKPEQMVYITRTGECYHRIGNCGTSKYVTKVTLSEAKDMGYRKCSRCY